MKIEVQEDYSLTLKEVFSGVGLETSEGNFMGICMRDDTFEFSIKPKGGDERWYRVDMRDGSIITGESDYMPWPKAPEPCGTCGGSGYRLQTYSDGGTEKLPCTECPDCGGGAR